MNNNNNNNNNINFSGDGKWQRVDVELYDYVSKAIDLLARCKGFVNPVELSSRAVRWLDFYEKNAGMPLKKLPLTVSDFLKHVGLDPARHGRHFGRLLKALYVEKYGKLPPLKHGIYQYSHADWDLFQTTYQQLDAYLDGGR